MDHQYPRKKHKEEAKERKDPFNSHFPFRYVLENIDEFFRNSMLKPGFRVNVEETSEEYIVTAELPGVKREHIAIDTMDHSVTIRVLQTETVTRQDDMKHQYLKHSSYQQMSRTIPFYHPINHQRGKARYKNGLLTLVLPKRKGKSIPIIEE